MIANNGKNSTHPTQFKSIFTSWFFLKNLVTNAGYHIVNHRLGSLLLHDDRPIKDYYGVMGSDYHFDHICINISNETNTLIPPVGYLFEQGIVKWNYDGTKLVDPKYVYKTSTDPEDDPLEILIRTTLSPGKRKETSLEIIMKSPFGTNQKVEEFPYPVINSLMNLKFVTAKAKKSHDQNKTQKKTNN